jgi:hypothetical protein
MKKRFLAAVFAVLTVSSLTAPTQARPCAEVTTDDVETALSIASIGPGYDFEGFDTKVMFLPYTGGKVRINMDGDEFIAGAC